VTLGSEPTGRETLKKYSCFPVEMMAQSDKGSRNKLNTIM